MVETVNHMLGNQTCNSRFLSAIYTRVRLIKFVGGKKRPKKSTQEVFAKSRIVIP